MTKLTQSEISTNIDLLIDQTIQGQEKTSKKTSKVSGASTTRSIAVIDRSANLLAAAKDISNARLTPNDTSPYSPDLVIVNDFIYKSFISECLKYAENKHVGSGANSFQDSKLHGDISEAEKAGQVEISRSANTNLTIVVIKDK